MRHKRARARLRGAVTQYGWTLRKRIQNGSSALEFDFWDRAVERYDNAVAEFNGPEFDRLLDDVNRPDWRPEVKTGLSATALPACAHVVVIGGGVVGCRPSRRNKHALMKVPSNRTGTNLLSKEQS